MTATIPAATTLKAWQQRAEDALVAVELWKTRAAQFEAALRNITEIEPGSRGGYGKFTDAQNIAKRALAPQTE